MQTALQNPILLKKFRISQNPHSNPYGAVERTLFQLSRLSPKLGEVVDGNADSHRMFSRALKKDWEDALGVQG